MATLHSDKLVALERLHQPKGKAAVKKPAKKAGDNLVDRLAARLYDVQRRA